MEHHILYTQYIFNMVVFHCHGSFRGVSTSSEIQNSPGGKPIIRQGSILHQALFQHAVGSASDHLRSPMQSLDVFGNAIASIVSFVHRDIIKTECRKVSLLTVHRSWSCHNPIILLTTWMRQWSSTPFFWSTATAQPVNGYYCLGISNRMPSRSEESTSNRHREHLEPY